MVVAGPAFTTKAAVSEPAGTPGGVEGEVLRYGQTVEVEVEGVGRLTNRATRVDSAIVPYVVSLKRWLASQGEGGDRAPSSFH